MGCLKRFNRLQNICNKKKKKKKGKGKKEKKKVLDSELELGDE